ncbi:GFA family protein [Maritimibacter fusiformis]|uniref:GFA family protein n=1 Tax=Maritimibacter fusiformis TaxID=2603819 RepID=A0A5D0R8G7_9RHOB|nr:GFA family protein [Maritimibacter fusiformis]TYB77792.1 GFA family protein [Maritimibacter fusiformis]
MKLTGRCLCGRVGFEVDGWVSQIQACHAERCRRATGGLFAPEIAASADGFRWVGDEGGVASYTAPILHEPPAYRRNFCKTCGSPLPVLLEGAGMVVLHAGLLDDCSGLQVFRHAFVDQRSACCQIDDDAPQFPGQPPVPGAGDIVP